MERLKKKTTCPKCQEELNDDDGVFFNEYHAIKKCGYCGLEIEFLRQLKRDIGNPYCDYVWHKTYMKWEEKEL